MVIASKTRLQIRQAIGVSSGLCILGTVTTTGDTASLLDAIALNQGGDNEYNGRQVQINTTPTGTIAVGEQSFVSSYAAATYDATMSPAFSAAVTVGDTYEMWLSNQPGVVSDMIGRINQMIADAETEVTRSFYVDKEDHTTFTESSRLIYDIPSGFIAIHRVEYNTNTNKVILHNCDAAWDELVDGDVTLTADTTIQKEGSGCQKMVVAAGASANDILATDNISSVDLSGCTEVEIWIRSSATLAAGAIQLLLDNTASCASPVESLDIPATTANTWTRHVITLANPESDSAIISVGIKLITDAAFTLYVDDIIAVNGNERNFVPLMPEYWGIIRGSTDYLYLTDTGLAVAGANTLLKLKGYQKVTAMTSDSSTSEVDPEFIKAMVLGELLDSDKWRAVARSCKPSTSLAPGTRII